LWIFNQEEKEDLFTKTEAEEETDEMIRKRNERVEKERADRLAKLSQYKVS
jgi:hypothetical protein